jgi:hypothetical protein
MKRISVLIVLLTILGLFFTATQVLAGPAESVDAKKTPMHTPGAQATVNAAKTPGAQATARAIQRATEGRGKPLGKRVNYKGTISSVDAASLTLTLEDGSFVTFGLTAETRIKIPTLGQSATAANLSAGMQANVHATLDDSGALTADIVLVIPGKPALTHRVGTVTDYQPGISITIQAQDGNPYTFLLTAETKILPAERADQLAVGARVTVIAPRDVAGGTLTASGIVIHPPVRAM